MGLRPTGRHAGFTLIEVLVVVAIIALLISILLPSLARAKEQARQAVCSANLSHMAKAASEYSAEQKDWIPGSPLTTGYWWVQNQGNRVWDPSLPYFNRTVVEWFDFTTPLRVQMYGSKSLPLLGTPEDTRIALLRKITEEPFACPCVQQYYPPYQGGTFFGGRNPPPIRMTSYLTMETIMRGGPGVYQQYASAGNPTAAYIALPPDWEILPPQGYLPRQDRLGRSSMKVFAADGLRYYSSDTEWDYNCDPCASKGIMTAASPAIGWNYGREYNLAHKFSYRHGNHNRFDAGFFDGHVEGMTAVTSDDTTRPFTGKATDPKYYCPSNSVINKPAELNRNAMLAGTKMP
jgi:prepilin-type N-terminal cleavage/methylation domain-containing protein